MDMKELFLRVEPLCEELNSYVFDGPIGKMIHHPLLISMTYHEQHCGIINESFRQKSKALDEAIQNGDYSSAIYLHERPYRYDALIDMINDYGFEEDDKFWPTVGGVWTDSENIFQNLAGWRSIWQTDIPDRHLVMSEEDQEVYRALPSSFEVYRGVQEGGTDDGLSWTLSREKAQWFADRFKGNGHVLTRIAQKSDVLAYFGNRDESEIVILPENLHG